MQKDVQHFITRVAATVKQERLSRNLSHEKLAELAGLSRRAVGKIEAGERVPTIATLYRLIKAMDMTWEEFAQKNEALR